MLSFIYSIITLHRDPQHVSSIAVLIFRRTIAYLQYLVSSHSVCCHTVHRLRADLRYFVRLLVLLYRLVTCDCTKVFCTQNIKHNAPPPKSQVMWCAWHIVVTCPRVYTHAKFAREVQLCCEPLNWAEGVDSEFTLSTSITVCRRC
jgi:hypothetical protein